MAKKDNNDSHERPDSYYFGQQEEGIGIRDNPRSILPNFQNEIAPSGRDVLLSALMGFGKSVGASQAAAANGDPLLASLAGIAGAAGQPGPQAVMAQRMDLKRQQMLAQLEASPVEQVAPGLVEAHPELAGLPLSIVQKLAPLIQRAQFFQAAEAGRNARAEMTTQREEMRSEKGTRSEERQLRQELQAKSKDFVTIRDNYARINQVAKSPSPAGDLSLIFSYMKLLDPGSTVRESEFQNAEKAAPILTRYGLDFNKLGSVWAGKKLTDEQRADFMAKAQDLYAAQKGLHDQTRSEYRRLAEVAGGKAENVDVIGGAETQKPQGEIRKRLKGGKIGVWDSAGNFVRYE